MKFLLLVFILIIGWSYSQVAGNCSIGAYNDTATGKCKNCSDVIPMCMVCTNASLCISCETGYFYDPIKNICANCSSLIPNCDYCENGSACLVCDNSSELQNGKCKLAPEGVCGPGTYTEPETGECVPCMYVAPNCTNCTDVNTCTGCNATFKLINGACVIAESDPKKDGDDNGDNGVKHGGGNCGPGYYWDDDYEDCIKCFYVMPYCYSCYDEYHCIQCEFGYFKAGKRGCLSCGDYLYGCKSCRDKRRCYKCEKDFKLNYKTGKCRKAQG